MEQWSYFAWVVKVPDVNSLGERLNLLGGDGWELATSVSSVKSWLNLTGNDLVFVFKKPGTGHRPSAEIQSALRGLDADVAY